MKILLLFMFLSFLPAASLELNAERDWQKEDKMALSITTAEARSVASLIEKIKSFKTDDWGKFRLAFRWIAEHITYDLKSYKSGNIKPSTPDQTLKARTAVCQGYADLLKAVADGLGITCEVVSGYSKGGGYEPGGKFTTPDHAWNAAQFDGRWYLFDATWAAGYTDAKSGRYYKRFESFYFAPDPEQFIFGHLPQDSRWQLIANPISLPEFEERTDVQVSLFRMGLQLEALRSICPSFQQCDLVHVNPVPADVGIDEVVLPFEKTLGRDRDYSFSITAPKGSQFFIENKPDADALGKKDGVLMWDSRLVAAPVAMVYKKGVYHATVTAHPGDLTIYVQANGKKNYIFFWKVK